MTMNTETYDMFAGVINEMANGPLVTSFQGLTESLLRRLSEKGLTLEQCADRKMLNRSVGTLEAHCREYGIRFPDYTPSNMRKHIMFVPSGDYLELTGPEVDAVAAVLDVVTTTRNCVPSCAIPAHAFDDAKDALRAAGYVAKKAKPAKKPKARSSGALLASSGSLSDIQEAVERFYAGTPISLSPVSGSSWRVIRASDEKEIAGVQVLKAGKRFRFEMMGTPNG